MYVRHRPCSIRHVSHKLKGSMARKRDPEFVVDAPNNWITFGAPDIFARRLRLLRIAIVVNLALGFNYLFWRYLFSINVHALWFAIPMVVAETYSILSNLLFCVTLWKP